MHQEYISLWFYRNSRKSWRFPHHCRVVMDMSLFSNDCLDIVTTITHIQKVNSFHRMLLPYIKIYIEHLNIWYCKICYYVCTTERHFLKIMNQMLDSSWRNINCFFIVVSRSWLNDIMTIVITISFCKRLGLSNN